MWWDANIKDGLERKRLKEGDLTTTREMKAQIKLMVKVGGKEAIDQIVNILGKKYPPSQKRKNQKEKERSNNWPDQYIFKS